MNGSLPGFLMLEARRISQDMSQSAVLIGLYKWKSTTVLTFPVRSAIKKVAGSAPGFAAMVGAAPNAIAYGSGQFTTGEFFKAGIPATILLVVVLTLFVWIIWPAMGMPVLLP